MGTRDRRPARSGAFTLIELIVALVILVIVLGMAYRILENSLRTEQWIEKENLPEKVGQGIMTLIRRDLEGTIHQDLGTDQVFEVIDGGSGEQARDEIHFYTTVEKTPLEDPAGRSLDPQEDERSITAVSYFLKENQKGLFTLFRREASASEADPFQGANGINYEIYDKVKSLSILCFDSQIDREAVEIPWLEVWDSRQRIQLAQEDVTAQEEAAATGIPRVSPKAGASTPTAATTAAAAKSLDGSAEGSPTEEQVLPPAAIPMAVRVEVTICAGDERGLFKDKSGNPIIRTFSTLVPLLSAVRIPLTLEEDATSLDGTGETSTVGGIGGPGGTGGTKGASPPKGTSKTPSAQTPAKGR